MKLALKALKILVALAVLAGLGYLVATRAYVRYKQKTQQAKAAAKAVAGPVRVTGSKVVARDLRRVAVLTGTVKPMAEVRVMSKVGGRLEALRLPDGTPVDEGTVIAKKGTPIAVIDHAAFVAQVQQAEAALAALKAEQAKMQAGARPEELEIARANVKAAEAAVEAAKANVAQAQASLKNATIELGRIRRLFDEKVATQQQLDGAETQFAIANERLAAAREQMRRFEHQLKAAREQLVLTEKGARQEDRDALAANVRQAEAALRLAQINLEEATIEAPIAGVVSVKHLDEGNMVSPGVPIVTIVQVDTVKVVVGAAERDLPFLKAGTTKATMSVDALPGETFEGTVQKISPVVDERTRTVGVEIHVPNPGRRLKPGMFARVELLLEQRKGVPTIPDYAVLWHEDKPSVVVVNGGKARRCAVKLGLAEGHLVEVLAGVKTGDTIVTRGQQGLKDGDPVVATEEEASP